MIGFTNKAVAHISAAITAGATQIRVHDLDYSAILSAYGESVFLMLRGPVNRELIKVDIDASVWGGALSDYLTVERGQGGTTAQSWPVGSMMFATTHEDHYNAIIQRGQNRTVDYNPNEILAPLFAGEEVYQSGPAGCERWWKSYNGVNPYWDIITGAACGSEEYLDIGWTYEILKPTLPPPLSWTLKKTLSLEAAGEDHVSSLVYDSDNDAIVAGSGTNMCQFWVSNDGGDTWTLKKELGGSEYGWQKEVYELMYDAQKGRIFAGTRNAGNIWASDDGGETWELKINLLNESPGQKSVRGFTYDPVYDRVLAGTADNCQIWGSDDVDSDDWTMLADLRIQFVQNLVSVLAYDPVYNKIIAGTGMSAELMTSGDGGTTWARKRTFLGQSVECLAYDPDTGRMLLTEFGNLWKSEDGGDTWSFLHSFYDVDGQSLILSLIYDPHRKRVIAGTYPNARIYESSDGGDTWTLNIDFSILTPPQTQVQSLCYESVTHNIIAGTGNDGQIWVGT